MLHPNVLPVVLEKIKKVELQNGELIVIEIGKKQQEILTAMQLYA